MARRVRYRNSLWVLVVLLCSCTHPIQHYDTYKVPVEMINGVAYMNNQPATGHFYHLAPGNHDTLRSVMYRDGKRDGFYKAWYENGNLKETRIFDNGLKTGIHQGFWENGKRAFFFRFKNGEYEGRQWKWYRSGKIFQVKNYKNGHEEGPQKEWNEEGKLVVNYEAKNGRQYGNIGKKNCASIWRSNVYAKPGY